jgi:predicted dehydrogenase
VKGEPVTKDRLRVIVVGVGRFGLLHVRAWTEAGAAVIGVCDIDPERAAEAARRFGVEHHSDDPEAMMQELGPQAVIIASDEASHTRLADAAIAAGCHVFVEKPFALSRAEADATVAAARAAGRSIVVGHISRFAQPYRYMSAALADGRLGQLWALRLKRDFSSSWFDGFGSRIHPVWESCIHDVDLAVYFAGVPARRVMALQSAPAEEKVPRVISALVEFQNGVTATIESAWSVPAAAPQTLAGALALDGSIAAEAEVIASSGTIKQRLISDALVEWTDQGARVPDLSLWPEDQGRLGGALRNEVEYAMAVFAGARPNDLTPESHAAWGVAIAEAIVVSLATGEQVVLPET